MKLSIIIPVYNVEKYLAKCLDSVICTTVSDYEIVAVNDGSTDFSLQILEEYRSKFPDLIRVISTPNGGLGAARNVGLQNVRGEFVVFLDSDDYYSDHSLIEILHECSNSDFDIGIFGFNSVNEDGLVIDSYKPESNSHVFSLNEKPTLLFDLPSACNKIFRTKLFTDFNVYFPSRVWFEDLHTIPKLYVNTNKIKYISSIWYNYLQRGGSITHSANDEKNLDIIEASNELLKYYKLSDHFNAFKEELEYCIYYNALLTSYVRVNLINQRSSVLSSLYDYFTGLFPDYEKNKYFRSMPRKYKLINQLIKHHMNYTLFLIMHLNDVIKHKL